MAKSADAFRTISEVAEWLDTPAHVLRFWESKFTQVKPVKRAGGRRYYRPADMVLLGGIKHLLHEEGLTIKGVQKMLRDRGATHVSALSRPLADFDAPGNMAAQTDGGDAPFAADVEADEPPAATVLPFRTPNQPADRTAPPADAAVATPEATGDTQGTTSQDDAQSADTPAPPAEDAAQPSDTAPAITGATPGATSQYDALSADTLAAPAEDAASEPASDDASPASPRAPDPASPVSSTVEPGDADADTDENSNSTQQAADGEEIASASPPASDPVGPSPSQGPAGKEDPAASETAAVASETPAPPSETATERTERMPPMPVAPPSDHWEEDEGGDLRDVQLSAVMKRAQAMEARRLGLPDPALADREAASNMTAAGPEAQADRTDTATPDVELATADESDRDERPADNSGSDEQTDKGAASDDVSDIDAFAPDLFSRLVSHPGATLPPVAGAEAFAQALQADVAGEDAREQADAPASGSSESDPAAHAAAADPSQTPAAPSMTNDEPDTSTEAVETPEDADALADDDGAGDADGFASPAIIDEVETTSLHDTGVADDDPTRGDVEAEGQSPTSPDTADRSVEAAWEVPEPDAGEEAEGRPEGEAPVADEETPGESGSARQPDTVPDTEPAAKDDVVQGDDMRPTDATMASNDAEDMAKGQPSSAPDDAVPDVEPDRTRLAAPQDPARPDVTADDTASDVDTPQTAEPPQPDDPKAGTPPAPGLLGQIAARRAPLSPEAAATAAGLLRQLSDWAESRRPF